MRINENTLVVGKQVLLVPYKSHHVNKYHQWMQSQELLEKTASEPLSLTEEYDMQEKWWKDDDKCTFIVLDKATVLSDRSSTFETNAMIGDVNLFLNNPDDTSEAEVEIMIAETSSRGKGCGKEAVKLMMYYFVKFLNIKKYCVKISTTNTASIALFKKLGFQLESHSEVFQETTFCLSCDAPGFQKIADDISTFYQTMTYDRGLQSLHE